MNYILDPGFSMVFTFQAPGIQMFHKQKDVIVSTEAVDTMALARVRRHRFGRHSEISPLQL